MVAFDDASFAATLSSISTGHRCDASFFVCASPQCRPCGLVLSVSPPMPCGVTTFLVVTLLPVLCGHGCECTAAALRGRRCAAQARVQKRPRVSLHDLCCAVAQFLSPARAQLPIYPLRGSVGGASARHSCAVALGCAVLAAIRPQSGPLAPQAHKGRKSYLWRTAVGCGETTVVVRGTLLWLDPCPLGGAHCPCLSARC
jgi:hypothetical protein